MKYEDHHSHSAAVNCTDLDSVTATQGVLVKHHGEGSIVWLCMPYAGIFIYNSQNLRFGPADLLLENSLYWASCVFRDTCYPPSSVAFNIFTNTTIILFMLWLVLWNV